MNAESGFTLFELMVVIAVIAILAVVTIPKYQKTVEHYQLESSAQKVVATLRYARQLAIQDRSADSYYVGFATDGMQILCGKISYNSLTDKIDYSLEAKETAIPFDTGVNFLPETLISHEPTLTPPATIKSSSIDQVTVNHTEYTVGITYVASDAPFEFYPQDICYQWEGFLGTYEDSDAEYIYTGLLESDISFTLQGSLGDKVTMTIDAVTGDVTITWP